MDLTSMKIVVIGANAAGAKAASRAKRVNPGAEVTVVERGSFISYGACGIPYFLSDEVRDVRDLMRTPAGGVRDATLFREVKGGGGLGGGGGWGGGGAPRPPPAPPPPPPGGRAAPPPRPPSPTTP